VSFGEIGKAEVVLTVELDKLSRGFAQGKKQVQGHLDDLDRRGKRFGANFGASLGAAARALGPVLGALGVAGGAAGFALLFRNALNAGEALLGLSQKLGVTVEGIQRLNFAAQQNNVTTGALESGLLALSRNMGLLSQGEGKLFNMLKDTNPELARQLAVTTDSEQGFLLLSDAIAKIESPTERAALAAAAFGRGLGSQLLPLLIQGSAEITALGRRAEELGLVMSTQLARDADAAGDALETVANIVKVNLTQGLLGASGEAKSFAEQFTTPEFAGNVRAVGEALGTIAGALFSIGAAAAGAVNKVQSLWDKVKGFAGSQSSSFLDRFGRPGKTVITPEGEVPAPAGAPTPAPAGAGGTPSPTQAFTDALAGKASQTAEQRAKEAQDFFDTITEGRLQAEGRIIELIERERDIRLADADRLITDEQKHLEARIGIHQIANAEIAKFEEERRLALEKGQEELGQKLADTLSPFIEALVEGEFTWKGFLDNLIQEFAKSGIQNLLGTVGGLIGGKSLPEATGATSALGGVAGGAQQGGAGGWIQAGLSIASLFLQHGGPFESGEAFVVGERGPEMLAVGQPGRVTPMRDSAGAPANVTMNIHGVKDADSFRRSEKQIMARTARGLRDAEGRHR
jgi:hypothetical protein